MTPSDLHPEPTSDQAIIRDFSCSLCGKQVGHVELYPPGVPRSRERGEEHPGRKLDGHWSYQSNGDRYGDSELTPAQYKARAESLARPGAGDFVSLPLPRMRADLLLGSRRGPLRGRPRDDCDQASATCECPDGT